MQRTTASVAAVLALVLLAGCTGITGGDANATATESTATTPASTATPVPNDTRATRPPSTFEVSNATASTNSVMAGRPAFVNATVANTGSTAGEQVVELRAVGLTADSTTVTLDEGERTTVSFGLNTTAYDPGLYAFSVRSANDSAETRIEIDANRTYDQFFANVTDQSLAITHTRVFAEEYVGIAFQNNTRYASEYYEEGDHMPAPQAAALEMAARPAETPQTINFLITDDGEGVWATNLTQSLAEQYANGSITPQEFRQSLTSSAYGQWADRGQFELENLLTWTTGDRARWAYAEKLATRLENSNWSHHYTVTDYGLYNETVYLPDTTMTYGPNESIYVEIQSTRGPKTAQYRNFSSEDTGVATIETIYKIGNLTMAPIYGERPKSVYIRHIDETGTLFTTHHLPAHWGRAAVDDDANPGEMDVYGWVVFDDTLTTDYDEDGEPKE